MKRFHCFVLFCLFLVGALAPAAQAQDGKKIYEQVCKSCHYLSDRKGTGPGFYGVHERWGGDVEEMVYFIRAGAADYSQEGRSKSDYIVNLIDEYNGTLMPAQAVSEAEAKAVLEYVKANAAPQQQAAAAPAAGGAGGDGAAGGGGDPSELYTGLTILVTVLAVAVFALILIIAVVLIALKAKQEDRQFEWTQVGEVFKRIFTNKFAVGTVSFVIVALALTGIVNFARSIGLHQGYKPVQPIAFSHVIHAGQYEIDCEYCHIGVRKSKSATIPSTNICTNCHHERGGIVEGERYGTEELAKVLASAKNDEPIEWVRIHNLPDLVYFNHSQHVAVAGLECEQCHGPVEEMEEVYQYSVLSMGWCINCHRETEVDVTKSDYYQTVHSAYLGSEEKVTVETLGGLSCSRCHY